MQNSIRNALKASRGLKVRLEVSGMLWSPVGILEKFDESNLGVTLISCRDPVPPGVTISINKIIIDGEKVVAIGLY